MSAFYFDERFAHSIAQCLSSVTSLSLQRASTDPLCQRVLVNALQAAGCRTNDGNAGNDWICGTLPGAGAVVSLSLLVPVSGIWAIGAAAALPTVGGIQHASISLSGDLVVQIAPPVSSGGARAAAGWSDRPTVLIVPTAWRVVASCADSSLARELASVSGTAVAPPVSDSVAVDTGSFLKAHPLAAAFGPPVGAAAEEGGGAESVSALVAALMRTAGRYLGTVDRMRLGLL